MITRDQITNFTRKYKTNETTVFREYLQLLFLSKFYSFKGSEKVFFKGGTALHLIYKAPRFSEDLDFTVELEEKKFLRLIKEILVKLSVEEEIEFKERETLAGKRFLLVGKPSVLPYRTFVNLDFSFREKVLSPQKSIVETDYPLIFSSFVYHLSKEELFAEKIRAVLTRKKGRDLYDLWFLLSQGTKIKGELVKEKLKYYHLEKIGKKEILKRIEDFSEKDFILDLRPFVPINEREKLSGFFTYLKEYLKTKLI